MSEPTPLLPAAQAWTARQLAMLAEMGVQGWSALACERPRTPVAPENAPHSAPTQGQPIQVTAVRHAAAEPKLPPSEGQPRLTRPAGPAASPLVARPVARAPLQTPFQAPALAAAAAAAAAPEAGAPRGSVSELTWPELQAQVQRCQACRLCDSRRQTVFGVGSQQASWLVVGEAPGEEEDRRGEPFVGKAGQLLDQMLAATGLTRAADGAEPPVARAFIANTLKCRPPANRNPSPEELAACAPYLQRQIELLQPRIIVAMGRFAAQALLGSSEPLGRLRGRVHERQGIPVIVTYHPAYLLRSPQDKALAWDDLCLAMEAYERSLPQSAEAASISSSPA